MQSNTCSLVLPIIELSTCDATQTRRATHDFGPLRMSARYHQPQFHTAPLKLQRDEAGDDRVGRRRIVSGS